MILTLKELAEHLKVNERTILRMLKCGQIDGKKIGGQWRFNGSQIDNVFFPSAASPKGAVDLKDDATPKGDADPVSLSEISRSQIGIPVSRTMDTSRMLMELRGTDPISVIEELTSPRIFNDLVLDTRDLQATCTARENLCSTAVGNGIAVPHPRDPISTLQLPGCIVYGFSKKGVDFGAADGKPVHMFFLCCSQTIDLHLHLMGALAHLLRDDTFVEKCMSASSPEDVLRAVLDVERNDFLRKDEDAADAE